MSVLDAIDATRICARWSAADPDAWATPVPVPPRRRRDSGPVAYSWRTLIRNPQAMLITGLVGTLVAVDAAVRTVTPPVRPWG